jgi:hypothetical protein
MPEGGACGALLVQIVPAARGGVRDYAEQLRSSWAAAGVASELLALDRASARSLPLAQRLAALQAGPPAPGRGVCVLLHFSGYGYEPRGLCGWLLRELQQSRRRLGQRLRVATLFHELFASGPPWRSAFWLSALQARIARRLARASDALATNSQHHAQWLQSAAGPGARVQVRPVFSNVGEPVDVLPAAARQPGLLVFGSASTRQRALQRLAAHAAELRALGVSHVVEAGHGSALAFDDAGFRRAQLGPLPVPELGVLLQAHRFALLDYPAPHLGKSSVFAAYAAHGCVVLNTAGPGPMADGLRQGQHYRALGGPSAAGLNETGAQAMADAARGWYQGHRLALQATEFLDLLARVPGRC